MTSISKTAETPTAKVAIKLTRNVSDKIADLDGDCFVTGREIYEDYEVTVTSKINNQSIHTTGKPGGFAFFAPRADGAARLGDAYVSREIYDVAIALIAELDAALPKTDEQLKIEADQVEAKHMADVELDAIAKDEAEQRQHPGWCDKCGSYCYGDCTAN